MNQREKTLAALVGLLVVSLVGYFVWSATQKSLNQRRSAITNLRNQLDQQDRTLRKASRATAQLQALEQQSLPKDRETANSLYQQWLLDLVDRLGFTDPSVQVAERRSRGGIFDQLRFEVDAIASKDQLVSFLAEFYTSADLHRIQQLSLKPIKGTRDLDVLISIEALSLPNSNRKSVGDLRSDRVNAADVAAFEQQILDRSMFFPANEPPQLQSIPDQRVTLGSTWRLTASATDPDTWDELQYSLQGTPPEGLVLEPGDDGQARLSWQPQAPGEYAIELLVADSGHPSRTDVKSFRVTVFEPPPAEETGTTRRVLGFDDATQTFLVATVASGNAQQAWFNVRTQGKMLKISVGDTIDIGSILGDLAVIGPTHVEITTELGTRRIRIGESLTEGTLVPPPRQADARS